ncbi:hypothetical protein PLEOSDRAFT_1057751 [Pleurotus ostreatus PC15]|uniref:BTB domain-containing protein n=1 Tax=Pleurotus ostreatus (strain PC15) TaxID=1137138 RepID=A0A067NBQ5_PLEO1|nr:hypothetical protein PLEOSDRAFT_1057751 [Pleurotus ostreatus PC15]
MNTSDAMATTESELEAIFQHILSPASMDTSYNQREGSASEIPTPPYTPLTSPSICMVPPSESNEHDLLASSEHTQRPSKEIEAPGAFVSLSTSFHPAARNCGDLEPDLVLLSADSVFFYVHSSVLRSASNNNLCGFLPWNNPRETERGATDAEIEFVMLPDQSQVLNIMLHFIYDISPAHHSPPFHILSQAVDRLHNVYGVDVNHGMQGSALALSSPRPSLFALLTANAPLYPVEVYALAASIDFYPLTKTASLYLHGLDLCPTDDGEPIGGRLGLVPEMGRKMGGMYLMRLVGMHKRRLEALRKIVCTAPEGHLIDRASEDRCSAEDQASLKRAWALAAAYIICTAGPGVSAQTIDGTFRPLVRHVTCSRCRQAMHKRLESMDREWGMAPRTI